MAKERRHDIRENLLLALDTLRTHKFRSFLTILGVLIGTMTIISVAAIIKGLDQQVVDAAEGFGTRSLFIFKFEPGITFHLTREERLRKPLTYEQAMTIKDQCPAVQALGWKLSSRALRPWPSIRDWKWSTPSSGAPRRNTSATSTPNFRTGASIPTSTTCTVET